MHEFLDGRVQVLQGDITKLNIDAIVNAANSSLMGGGGVDGAIHRAGGKRILEECKKIRSNDYPEGLPPGQAVVTTAGSLPSNFVIHTVGPVWHGGKSGEKQVLTSAYINSLILAAENSCKTVAFPAISTGIYGYPKDKAANTAFLAIQTFVKENPIPEIVTLIFFAKSDMDIFIQAVL